MGILWNPIEFFEIHGNRTESYRIQANPNCNLGGPCGIQENHMEYNGTLVNHIESNRILRGIYWNHSESKKTLWNPMEP